MTEGTDAGAASPKPDHLYVIGAGDGIVKIGRSANPASRLSGIQTGNPKKMMILHVVPGAGDLESQVHAEFHGCRLGGEWFDFCEGDPVAEVARAIVKIREAEARMAADTAKAEEERAAAGEARGHYEINFKPKPRPDACRPYDCSHFATLSVAFAAAQRFVDAYPEEAADFLAAKGFAWHCIESAFPDLAKDAEVA